MTRPADLPDYWLSRPAPLLDPTVAAEFDQLLAAAETSGPVQPIEYRSRHPLWQFLCHVADTGRYVLHGSGSGDVSQFEPRQANDSEEFGNRMGVYAAADGIWAMYYAVVDRALASGLVNACVRFGDPGAAPEEFHGPYYYFSVDADDHPAPWRTGYVYLLPADGFESQQQVDSDGRSVLIAQRFNPEPVRPTAQVVVHPEDFPYLEQVHRHVKSEINERHAADPDGFPWHTS